MKKIAIIAYYESDFNDLVAELVENQGFVAEPGQFTWIKDQKNIPNGILFDEVLVELGSEDMYSWADLEKLKSQIPLKREKFQSPSEDPEETLS